MVSAAATARGGSGGVSSVMILWFLIFWFQLQVTKNGDEHRYIMLQLNGKYLAIVTDFEKYPVALKQKIRKQGEAIRQRTPQATRHAARCICNLQWVSRRGVDIYRQAGVKEEREQR